MQEPLPEDSPFWAMQNVLISPHGAFKTEDTVDQMRQVIIDNAHRVVAGQPLINVHDFERGY